MQLQLEYIAERGARLTAAPLCVSGDLAPGDLKRLTRLARRSTIGPTATYYAGVTAPIISAAVAIFGKTAFQAIDLPAYWVFMFSAMMAALAGIAWYLIFMRWSYRHTVGRGGELTERTDILACADCLSASNPSLWMHKSSYIKVKLFIILDWCSRMY
ncbi:MAG: hypothetical protein MRY64_06675, partial [Hyphomonadaceae bacterium]|nr:hypothetical protein [Hyphomonadaceae bacterium]